MVRFAVKITYLYAQLWMETFAQLQMEHSVLLKITQLAILTKANYVMTLNMLRVAI